MNLRIYSTIVVFGCVVGCGRDNRVVDLELKVEDLESRLAKIESRALIKDVGRKTIGAKNAQLRNDCVKGSKVTGGVAEGKKTSSVSVNGESDTVDNAIIKTLRVAVEQIIDQEIIAKKSPVKEMGVRQIAVNFQDYVENYRVLKTVKTDTGWRASIMATVST